jgi:ribosomal-protein-alanine N-acetyltransferase
VTSADAGALLEISIYDGVAAGSEADVREQLDRIVADQARGETVHWAIEDAATGVLVGTVGFYRGFATEVGEVGYVLLPAQRSRGFMTEAVALAVAYGFEALGLQAVIARTDATNQASIAVLERCAFTLAGAEDELRTYRLDRPT